MNKIEWTARPSCLYNGGVECDRAGSCEKCGWRPDVAAQRLKKLARAADGAKNEGLPVMGGVCA